MHIILPAIDACAALFLQHRPVLLGEISTSGNFSGMFIHQLRNAWKMKCSAQVSWCGMVCCVAAYAEILLKVCVLLCGKSLCVTRAPTTCGQSILLITK